jgi:pimeloyl-ACP methyl ester carboxylesterase
MPTRRSLRPLFCLAIICAVAGCSSARLGEASRILADIDAGFGASVLKAETPVPIRKPILFAVDGRRHAGDLYVPAQGAKAALVLVPGVAPSGKDDPRLVAFATTLARAKFRVLVPDLVNLRASKVRPGDARAISDAARWLDADAPELKPLGIVAVSYAVGPAVASLFEADTRDRVEFLLLIGGYYDLTQVVTFFTTGRYRERDDRRWRRRTPNNYGKWVFLESNLDRLGDRNDQALLRTIKDERIRKPGADVSEFVAGLKPDGRAVFDLIDNKDPARVPGLIARLPQSLRKDFDALDLSARDLSGLTQRFFLVHGRDDPIIPETESRRLAGALPEGAAGLFLVDSLDHVDPKPVGFTDKMILLRAIYGVLGVRDGD